MKKLLILIFLSSFTLSSCVDEYDYQPDKKRSYRGGAINNDYHKTSYKKRNKRKKIISPASTIGVGVPKKLNKRSNFRSIKSQNYQKIEEYYEEVGDLASIYDDFDEIFQNGHYIGHYKIGNKYEIEGVPYYPQEYEDYEEIGVASWYGEAFDGKATANGEIYNLHSMTAAHQTLPLPSVVKVTNLENGYSVTVRVNDRGPFAKNRIIDLSKKAAEILEYKDKGTTIVKIEYLPEETEALHKKLKIKK